MPERMSDEAVKAKTGKTWSEWFTLLDNAGARKLKHKEITDIIFERKWIRDSKQPAAKNPGWWTQMVTVAYEQESGLRKVHQTPDGFAVSVSRTLTMPVEDLFKKVKKILPKDVVITTETKSRSLRGKAKNNTRMDIGFYDKGEGKSQISLQQSKLKDAVAVDKAREMWKELLEKI